MSESMSSLPVQGRVLDSRTTGHSGVTNLILVLILCLLCNGEKYVFLAGFDVT